MEKPLFQVSAQGWKSIDELTFYRDRLEHEWKTPPTASGNSVYLRQALSPYISSHRTFGWGASDSLRSFGWYLGIGLILHFGFEKPLLQLVGILFYAAAVALLIYGLTRLKREEWLYVTRKDGAPVVTLRASGIGGWTPDEFRQKYADYVREDGSNHATASPAIL